jgi:8-oxo-dGTP pyrophosphatase MutT (NUDIX family)
MKISTGHITIQDIEEALKNNLPGNTAHQIMLPEGRSLAIPPEKFGKLKESAVMVFLFMKDNELNFCLTRRNSNMKHHPGQISFPGGRCEENESSIFETALRELEEETGVDKTKVKVIGELSDLYVFVSNFMIHPVVGFLDYEPIFEIDPREVEELITIPIKSFFIEKNISNTTIETTKGLLNVPCYKINELIIWGATAMIIAEFTEQLTAYYLLMAKYSGNVDNGPEQLKQN